MNEDDKNPKKAFNEKAPDTSNIRDQDNADKEYSPPNNESQPRPNAAPRGMSGIKTNNAAQTEPASGFTVEFTPDFDQEEPNIDLSLDNTLIDGKTDHGVEFIVRQEDTISPTGIDGGRISRLTLVQDGAVTAHYDNKWVVEPNTPLEIQTVDDLQDKFGEVPQREFKGFHDPNPDNDHEI